MAVTQTVKTAEADYQKLPPSLAYNDGTDVYALAQV
jgi:hypothetical protein